MFVLKYWLICFYKLHCISHKHFQILHMTHKGTCDIDRTDSYLELDDFSFHFRFTVYTVTEIFCFLNASASSFWINMVCLHLRSRVPLPPYLHSPSCQWSKSLSRVPCWPILPRTATSRSSYISPFSPTLSFRTLSHESGKKKVFTGTVFLLEHVNAG